MTPAVERRSTPWEQFFELISNIEYIGFSLLM